MLPPWPRGLIPWCLLEREQTLGMQLTLKHHHIAFRISHSHTPLLPACQAKTWEEKQIAWGFSLSPSMKRYIYNHTNENSTTGTGWSWYQWLLSNEVGAVANVSALAQLLPITIQLLKVSGVVSEQHGRERRLHISQEEELYNHTLPGAAVCLPSPFIFLLTNATGKEKKLDCKSSSRECFLSKC